MYTKVTETLFDAVKLLIKGGAKNAECAKYMNISTATVSVIRNSETYLEYKQNMHAISGSERKRKQKQAAAIAAKAKAEAEAQEQAKQAQEQAKKQEETPQEMPQSKTVEHKYNVTIQATHYMEEQQKRTNELLTIISNKLAFIVDELTGVRTGA